MTHTTDVTTTIVDGYLSAWNERDPERRAELIKRVWAQDGRLLRTASAGARPPHRQPRAVARAPARPARPSSRRQRRSALAALHSELASYPGGERTPAPDLSASPLRLRHQSGELRFISTVTTFGTAVEVTVSELSIKAFFPADAATAQCLRAMDDA